MPSILESYPIHMLAHLEINGAVNLQYVFQNKEAVYLNTDGGILQEAKWVKAGNKTIINHFS